MYRLGLVRKFQKKWNVIYLKKGEMVSFNYNLRYKGTLQRNRACSTGWPSLPTAKRLGESHNPCFITFAGDMEMHLTTEDTEITEPYCEFSIASVPSVVIYFWLEHVN